MEEFLPEHATPDGSSLFVQDYRGDRASCLLGRGNAFLYFTAGCPSRHADEVEMVDQGGEKQAGSFFRKGRHIDHREIELLTDFGQK